MPKRTFDMFTRHDGDRLYDDALLFLSRTQEALGVQTWLWNNNPFPVTIEALKNAVAYERAVSTTRVPFRVDIGLYSENRLPDVWLHFGMFGRQFGFRDLFRVFIDENAQFPGIEPFRGIINSIPSLEARLSDVQNEHSFDMYNLYQNVENKLLPLTIRWLHFLGPEIVDMFGGLQRCLAAPIFRAERFADGVLLQLVSDQFDNSNTSHLKAQDRAMRYFRVGPYWNRCMS